MIVAAPVVVVADVLAQKDFPSTTVGVAVVTRNDNYCCLRER